MKKLFTITIALIIAGALNIPVSAQDRKDKAEYKVKTNDFYEQILRFKKNIYF